MKTLLISLFFALTLSAQYAPVPATQYPTLEAILNAKPAIVKAAGVPASNCTVALDLYLNTTNGDLYVCYPVNVWLKVTGAGGAGGAWGSITGTLASQTDLGAALAGKEPANANIQTHVTSTANPHAVTAAQVGLGNASNTSDANKPLSSADVAALALKANAGKCASPNLLLQSQTFANAAWTKVQSDLPITNSAAPDATLTASFLREDATVVGQHSVRQGAALAANTTYTVSVYAKAGTRSFLSLVSSFDGTFGRVYYNLGAGSMGTADTGLSGTITAVPGAAGWYRCTMTFTNVTAGSKNVYISPATVGSGSGDVYQGDGISGLSIWGAQINPGVLPASYTATTTAATTAQTFATDLTGTTPACSSADWSQLSNAPSVTGLAFDPLTATTNSNPKSSVIERDTFGRYLVRDWDAQLGKGLPIAMLVLGDSWTANDSYTGALRTSLTAAYGNAGVGYIAFDNRAPTQPGEATLVNAGTWVYTNQLVTSKGINASDSTSSDVATPASSTVTAIATTFNLQYIKQLNGGSFRYQVDGGAFTTVATANASTVLGTVAISGLSLASHVLRVEVTVAGTAGVTLLGVDCQRSGPGVRLHRVGNPGATANGFAIMDPTIWEAEVTALNPNVVTMLFGVNELLGNMDPVTGYNSYLGALVDRVRVAAPNADCILMAPADVGVVQAFPMATYSAAMQDVARARGCAFLDFTKDLGPYAAGAARGIYTNTTHVNATGGAILAGRIYAHLAATPGLQSASNLADLPSAAAARANLGLANAVDKTVANTYPAGAKQGFQSSATTAGMNFGGVAVDPSVLTEGDTWYRTDLKVMRQYRNGAAVTVPAFDPTGNFVVVSTVLETDIATPTPDATKTQLYAKGGKWCSQSTAGVETCMGTGGSMTYPGAGVPISSGSAWSASVALPADAAKYLNGAGAFSVPPSGASNPHVVYVSQIPGINLNGSLSANTGTSDKAAIQAVLNTATATSPLLLIVDGVIAIDTSNAGLVMMSHTHIRCLGSNTGFSWLSSTNLHQKPLITNPNPLGIATPIDTDYMISGCSFNGNVALGHGGIIAHQTGPLDTNSDGYFLATVRLVGVTHIVYDNLYCGECTGIGFHFGNISDFSISNIRVSRGGMQVEGPASHGVVSNFSGTNFDDMVAFNADDGHLDTCTAGAGTAGAFGDNTLAATVKQGPITDILIDGIHAENSFETLRLLSGISLMDNITVRNLTGTTFGHLFTVDIFPPCFEGVYPGNFGRIRFENITAKPSAYVNNYGGMGAGVTLSAKIRSLKMDINLDDYAPTGPVFLTGPSTNIGQFDLKIGAISTGSLQAPILNMQSGVIDHLNLSGYFSSATQSIFPLIDQSAGAIKVFQVGELHAENINNILLQHGGTIHTSIFGPGRHMGAGGHGTINQATGNTITNSIVSGWATSAFHEGAGTITNSLAGISTDIAADATPPPPNLLTGLVAFWHMTEAAGAARVDSSGNGHTLTNVGTVGTVAAPGKTGNVTAFAGSLTDYLTTPGPAFTVSPTTGYTMGAWVYATTYSGAYAAAESNVIGKMGASYEFVLFTNLNPTPSTWGTIVGTGGTQANGPINTVGTWAYVVIGFEPGVNRAWISTNGGPKTYATGAPTLLVDQGYPFAVGVDSVTGQSSKMYVGHLGVWNRTLTAAEITALYNGGTFYDPI